MDEIVSYALDGPVATIAMNDGKANALSLRMLEALNGALDRAEADGAVVVLTGKDGLLSAGFDLKVLQAGGADAVAMVRGGFELAARLLSFPTPVVVACPGHAVAMASFLLLSGDYRVGAAGPYRITANEVALGITMPWAAIAICRARLTPAHLDRVVLLAEVYSPDDAVPAGFLDQVVEPGDVLGTAQSVAAGLASLNMHAHAATKRRLRQGALDAIRSGIEADEAALAGTLG